MFNLTKDKIWSIVSATPPIPVSSRTHICFFPFISPWVVCDADDEDVWFSSEKLVDAAAAAAAAEWWPKANELDFLEELEDFLCSSRELTPDEVNCSEAGLLKAAATAELGPLPRLEELHKKKFMFTYVSIGNIDSSLEWTAAG